jgi:hypothetical protein
MLTTALNNILNYRNSQHLLLLHDVSCKQFWFLQSDEKYQSTKPETRLYGASAIFCGKLPLKRNLSRWCVDIAADDIIVSGNCG